MPSALNAIEIINYTYFSKIAQKATQRVNYLGFVANSFAFDHHLETERSLFDKNPIRRREGRVLGEFAGGSRGERAAAGVSGRDDADGEEDRAG